MTNTITITNLCKEYGKVQAVNDLNLSIEEGSVFGFLGPNGSGKSTTIGMLLGLVRPTDGEAEVAGYNPQLEPVSVRSNVGILPEGFAPYPSLTGREHLEYISDLRGIQVDVGQNLSQVGLLDAGDRVATGYSKGMTQRLGLSMALIGQPDVLILDEPFTGLDPDGSQLVREVVQQERNRGTTILFSSHILGQVEILCDDIGVLSGGSLVAEGSLKELQSEGELLTRTTLLLRDQLEEAIDLVSNFGFTAEPSQNESEIVVEHDAETSHLDIVRELDRSGIHVADARVQPPTVEDIYRVFTATEGRS